MQYFYANGNEQRGPHSLEELASFGLRPDTLVWREGMDQWQRADTLPELVERAAQLEAERAEQERLLREQQQPVVAEATMPAVPTAAQHVPQYQQTQPIAYHGTAPGTEMAPSGLAIASMILGIVSVLSLCIVVYGLLPGIPCSILAVVFGFSAKGKANRGEAGGRGMAIAGLVMGFVYLGLWGALLLVGIVIGIAVAMAK